MNLSKIIASVAGTIVLALGWSLFCMAGQNSELQNELSQTKSELTRSKQQVKTANAELVTIKQQVKTLSLIIDQANDRIRDLNVEATYGTIFAELKQAQLKTKPDYCKMTAEEVLRLQRMQNNMRKAKFSTVNKGHTDDPTDYR